ncbi:MULTISPECIES: VanZ family protein [unclassified Leucobacter]|uniref:VanZ family protein n=1 Tax=unclassified Leucobacter TaxID=2621730 RepID=UPI000B222710|nr:VanZ family protein [Leucobacter sp. Ag1]
MNDPFAELPALPIVVPLGVIVFVLLCWRLRATGRFSIPRAAVAAALAVYAAGIVANTVFPIFLDPPALAGPWWSGVVLTPFADYEVEDALTNVIVFLPLGILIPLLMRRPGWWQVLLAVVGTSLGIELTQLAAQDLAGGGHIADINDLIFNTIGGLAGSGLLVLFARIPGCDRIVRRFSWSERDGAAAAGSGDVSAGLSGSGGS